MGFSTKSCESLPYIKAARLRYDEEYQRKSRVAFNWRIPTSRIQRAFDLVVGADDARLEMRAATAANGRAKTALRKRAVRAIALKAKLEPDLDFIFGTIIHSPWNTMTDNTRIGLADLQQRSRNVINMCGFKGAIIMIEFQVEPYGRRTIGWPLYPNVHFIAWVDPGFNKRKVGERVRKSRRLTGFERARTFVLSRKMKACPDLWRRVCYLVKEPSSGKKRHKVTGRFEGTFQDMHPDACLRLTEVLSHLRLSELLMLTGDAKGLRKQLLRPIPANQGPQVEYGNSAPSPARLWDSTRANDQHFYQPIQVIRAKRRPKQDPKATRARSA